MLCQCLFDHRRWGHGWQRHRSNRTQIGIRQHRGDPRHGLCQSGVDIDNPGMGMRAAGKGSVQNTRHLNVVQIQALTRQQTRIFDPLHRGSKVSDAHGLPSRRITAAASRAASTMVSYPVHRHRLPEIASRIPASSMSGSASITATRVINIPGVQNPH